MKRHKYHARRTVVDGIAFDSAKEAKRWQELKLLERAGHIRDVERQFSLQLLPAVRLVGDARVRPAVRYVIDFKYTDAATGEARYEDAKGMETDMSRLKRHMAALMGIQVRCV